MNKFSEKQLLFGTIGLTVLLAAGIGFLIWRDFETIQEEELLIETLEGKIAQAEGEIAQIEEREFRAIANREISDKEVEFLPEETEIEDFWEVLERMAEGSGVKISKITPASSGRGRGRRRRRGKASANNPISQVNQVMNLRATADEFLRFINLIENYDRIINVVDFELTSGSMDFDMKVRHNIKLSLRTFTYSKKITNTVVSIPNYEKKQDHTRVKEWISRIAIEEKDQYTLSAAIGRRDPFVDVRTRIRETNNDATDKREREQQEELFRALLEDLKTLQVDLQIEKKLAEKGMLYALARQRRLVRQAFQSLAERIEQVHRENIFSERDLQDQFKKQIVLPFNEIRKELGTIDEQQRKINKAQAEEFLVKIRKFFDERDWKGLADEYRAWRGLSKNGERVEDEAREIANEIADLHRRSKVIQAFDKRKIVISAIVYSPDGVSITVINGKLRGEADALDADGTVIVAEIGENFVIFHTEGVDIKRLQTKKN